MELEAQALTNDIQQIVVGAKRQREQLFQDLQMQTASFEELPSEHDILSENLHAAGLNSKPA
eukprot:3282513-Rhodomonas_salina.2